MLRGKQKLKIAAAFVTLLLFAATVGCNGFFVDPTLTGVTILPSSPSLQTVGQTLQLIATGTYNDGSTQNLSGSSGTTWSSSDPQEVSVNSTGLIKAVTVPSSCNTTGCTVTITVTATATTGAATGTATVTLGTSSGALTVTCNSCTSTNTISIASNGGVGSSVSFSAEQNGSEVTSEATWTSTNTSVITITGPGTGTLTGQVGNTTIQATLSGATGSLAITVTQ